MILSVYPQTLNPLIDCHFVDAVKMIRFLISNYVKFEVKESKYALSLSFRAAQYDIPLQWDMAPDKLISNEMFHHFVNPLVGALSKSHKIGTFLSDKWKSTRLYLDYVCLNNSIKADVNKSFLNIPNDFSDLEDIVELSQVEVETVDDFSLIRGPFERQVKKNCDRLRSMRTARATKSNNEPKQLSTNNIGDKDGSVDDKQHVRLKNLADKLDKERNKQPKIKKKKLI